MKRTPTVGEALGGMMAEDGWEAASVWAALADTITCPIVGGSKKHGGADLGPTSRQAVTNIKAEYS